MIADISSVSKVIAPFNRILVKESKSFKQPNSVQVSLLRCRSIFLKEVRNRNSYRQLEEFKKLWFYSSPSRVPYYWQQRPQWNWLFHTVSLMQLRHMYIYIFTLILCVVHFQCWEFNFKCNFTLLMMAAKLKYLSLSPFEYWDSSSYRARNMSI